MKKRTRILAVLLSLAMTVTMLAGCGGTNGAEGETAGTTAQTEEAGAETDGEIRTVVDATGEEIEVPAKPKAIAIAPPVLPSMAYGLQGTGENFLAISPSAFSGYDISVMKDLAPELADVNTDVFANDINMEELAAMDPDLVILFDTSEDQAEQLKALDIPVAMVTAATDIDSLKSLLAMLGDILNCNERAEQLLSWYEEVESYIDSKQEEVAALSEEDKPRVLHFMYAEERNIYASGVNPYITELEGGQNIVLTGDSADTSSPTMEEILSYDPEIIFLSNFDEVTPEDLYNNNLEGQDWSSVSAVKNHQVYKVPCGLYRWAPPMAIEKPLYMLWTASIVQPEIFSDIDIRQEIKDFFSEFFNYDISEEQIDTVLRTELNR